MRMHPDDKDWAIVVAVGLGVLALWIAAWALMT